MFLSAGNLQCFFLVLCARCSLACFMCCYRSHGRGCEGSANSACGIVGLGEKKRKLKRLLCHILTTLFF